jgi:hypothetical protein
MWKSWRWENVTRTKCEYFTQPFVGTRIEIAERRC